VGNVQHARPKAMGLAVPPLNHSSTITFQGEHLAGRQWGAELAITREIEDLVFGSSGTVPRTRSRYSESTSMRSGPRRNTTLDAGVARTRSRRPSANSIFYHLPPPLATPLLLIHQLSIPSSRSLPPELDTCPRSFLPLPLLVLYPPRYSLPPSPPLSLPRPLLLS
jgi:hypothetical protein